MAARRFRLEIDGRIAVGLAFSSEHELEAFLCDRGIVTIKAVPATAAAEPAKPRGRGRPNRSASLIEKAATSLGRKLRQLPRAEAARRIQRKIAGSEPASAVPDQRTVERWLEARQKLRRK